MEKMIKVEDVGGVEGEIEVVQWFVNPGDAVKKGDRLLEIMIGKSNVEIVADVDGTVKECLVEEGEIVELGDSVAKIEL